MSMHRSLRIGAAGLAIALSAALAAHAEREQGQANPAPWSGYWWQHTSGGLTGPLALYDRVAGTAASPWEQANHVETASEGWFGHCHAWSASAVMEQEPQQGRTARNVAFGIGDLKGLLAAVHAADVANSYGDRYGDGQGSEDFADLKPDELWRILNFYLKQNGTALVLDFEGGAEVWNYPVYQYQVTYEPAGDGWYNGVMQLVAADDNVDPDFVGIQEMVREYTFRVRFQNGALVMGSGEWTGESVSDHPDFGWYPYVAVPENPEVEVAKVSEIFGYPVGGSRGELTADGSTGPTITPDDNRPDNNRPDDNRNRPDNERPDNTTTPDRNRPDNTTAPDNTAGPVKPRPIQQVLSQILDPYELVQAVLNRTSGFELDATVDRGDGGKYRAGEPVGISVRSGQAGYLYLFDIDPEGGIHLAFPAPGEPNYIEARMTYEIASAENPILLAAGHGQHDLKAIVVKKPLKITGTRQVSNLQQQADAKPAPKPRTKGKPQRVVVPPTTEKQMKALILTSLRKGGARPPKAPGKLGESFAQDQCAYFVFDEPDQPGKPKRRNEPAR